MARLLTPQYASPEHVRGQPVTTASDVYSLGVILYELLCGARPYRVTAQQSTAEIERTVCDTDPPAPSSVAPGKMRRMLRGDVDNIVLKALQKDPRDRYGTAAELGEDVRRHLDGFPVLAQPDRVGYRAGKFVRRHRAGAAAAAVAIVSLVAGLGGALWQGRVARLERDHARSEAAKTQQIATFLSGVFQSANPILARGKTVTARDLLDRATSSIAPGLEKDPDVEASLLLAMSDAYASLTVFDKSAELAERALAIRRQSAPHSIAVADALQKLGRLQRRIGQGARGVALLEEALALRETLLGRDDTTVAQTLVDLVGTRNIIGRSEGNREMLERAIAILERNAPTSAALADAYNVLGAYFYDRGEFVNARTAAERSIAVFEKSNEPTSVAVIAPLLNLGDMLRQQGDLIGARSRFERVLAINETLYGKESMTGAYALGRLGDLARAIGDLPLAHDLLERSLAMYANVVGPDYYESAEVVQFLGQTLMLERKPREALALFDRAMRMIERAHGPDHPDLAETLVHVARARALVDGPAATEPLLRRALAIQRQALLADSEALVPTLTALGQVLGQGHKKDEARPLLEEAVRIAHTRLPERRADRLEAEAALAGLNQRAGS